ncbi:MAG: alpha/beta fold hydrolase [Pseudodesulfovibrio sp.]|nr:alpha/beta fold hydrolase [Pseudodesulfovibrio sp.]
MKIIILFILIFLVILWPLTRYAVFLVSNYRAGHLVHIREQLGGLMKPLFKGVLTAMAAEAIAVATYPLALLSRFESEGPGTPVLMVHGLYHNTSAWFVFGRRLRRAGFGNLHTYGYNSFTRNFTQAVDGLERKLDSLLGARPDSKVILVGHSLGGLVCRRVAGNPLYRDRIAVLVTLGAPHKGSELAWFAGNRMARDLIPGKATPNSVAAVPDPYCPELSIYTLVDDFVFPLDKLQIGRPDWQERVCSPMSHVWMVYSREVADMVIEFLRSASKN